MKKSKMFYHFWPLIIGITIVLYILILITLPFSNAWTTIFLFTLISYWSRLPGCGIRTPFFALYLADVVDLFSMIIAINIGGFIAAVFSAFCNLASRIGGVTPPWNGVINLTIIQALVCIGYTTYTSDNW